MGTDQVKDAGNVPPVNAFQKAKDRSSGSGDQGGLPVKPETRGRKSTAEKEKDALKNIAFSPETMQELVTLPFDMLEAGTGWDGWRLSDGEKKVLSVTGSDLAKNFITIDPKWISLTIFSLTMLKLLGSRYMAYNTIKKEEAKREHGKIEKA